MESFEVELTGIFSLIWDIADSGADGHDEINEDTHEAYINLLEGKMKHIVELCRDGLNLVEREYTTPANAEGGDSAEETHV
jgi:hypothetical protein